MICSRPNCQGKVKHRGWCEKHYFMLVDRPIGWVDPRPVVEHLAALKSSGLGYVTIAKMAGVGHSTVQYARRRPKMRADVVQKILAVPIPMTPHVGPKNGAWIDSTGSRRRLQALVANGYLQGDLAARLSLLPSWISEFIGGEGGNIRVSNARRIHDLFEQLQLVPGPSNVARRQGIRRGWALPLAWDEDTIDDPSAQPVMLNDKYDWLNEYDDLIDMGIPQDKAIERLGLMPDTVKRRISRRERAA